MDEKKKILTLSEEIQPLSRDSMNQLRGGFLDVEAVMPDGRTKNKTDQKCENSNCSKVKNDSDVCSNQNCECTCQGVERPPIRG